MSAVTVLLWSGAVILAVVAVAVVLLVGFCIAAAVAGVREASRAARRG